MHLTYECVKFKNKISFMMKWKGLMVLALISCSIIVSAFYPSYNFKEKESMILNAVLNYLDVLHFKPVDIDDKFSEEAFDQYVQTIDPQKRFLLQSEVDQMSIYKDQIDDQARLRSFEFFDASVVIINGSHARAKKIYKEVINSDLETDLDEYIELDSDKRTFSKDENALKDQWRRIITYDLINRMNRKIEAQEKAAEEKDKTDGVDPEAEMEIDVEDSKTMERKLEMDSEIDEPKTVEEIKEESIEAIKKSYETWFKALNKDRRSDKFERYVNAMTHLFDPHSDYLNPKEKKDFDIRMGGKLEGIGARLSSSDEMTKVNEIIPGGPAWKGKELEVDDLITAVRQEQGEALNIVGMRLDDVVQKIRGNKGTIVYLTVKKPDGNIVEITIERDEVIIDEGFAKSLILDMPGTIEKIGYIRLPKFYSSFEREGGNSCAKDVEQEIKKLKEVGISGMILDLRGNGGGSLPDVIDMTGLFIKDGPVVQVKPRNKEAYVYEDEDSEVHYDGPLVVMVNQFSASASEILAAALQDYKRAILVGSPSTFGKGTVQRFVDLDRAYRDESNLKPLGNLKITMQKFYRIDGGSTQLKGVESDIILPNNYQFIETGEKDYDHALQWTEISPVEYSQEIYVVENVASLNESSQARVSKNDKFQKILENAERLKKNSEETKYQLDLESFASLRKKREKESEKYKGLYDDKIPNFVVSNLEVDKVLIQSDSSRIARNEDWIEGIEKDFYLEEVMNILKDMKALEN